jgi:hypothetical protein
MMDDVSDVPEGRDPHNRRRSEAPPAVYSKAAQFARLSGARVARLSGARGCGRGYRAYVVRPNSKGV